MSAAEEPIPAAWLPASAKPRRGLSRSGLLAVAALIVVLRAIPHLAPFVGPFPLEPGDPVDFAFRFVAYVLLGAAALLALSRTSTVRLGWLLVAITATDAIWALQFIPLHAFFFLTDTFQGFSSVLLAHILVSFPSGTLATRFDRRLIGGVYVYFVVVGTVRLLVNEPAYACDPGDYCPVNPFAVWANRDVVLAIDQMSPLVVPVIGLLVAFAVFRHWRNAGPVRRRILLPIVIALPLDIAYNTAWYASQSYDVGWLQELVQLPFVNVIGWILPAGFLIGVVRARADRTALPAAVIELGALPTTPQLESILRSRLGDPGLRVVRWSRALDGFLDSDGRRIVPPSTDGPQRLIELRRDGVPVAGVILDAALDDPGLEATITGLVRLAVDATDLRDELRAYGGDVAGLPTGEVTFLFGDIESSTRLLEELGEVYARLLSQFRSTVVDVADAHGGRVVDARADELFCVFRTADDAVGAAVDLLRRVAATSWPHASTVRLRIGLHTGRPALTETGYVGLDVHRAARIMAAASGGQILASGAVAAAMEDPAMRLRSLGPVALRGLSEPMELLEVMVPRADGDRLAPSGDHVRSSHWHVERSD